MLDNPVPLILGLIGSAGLGGFFREIVLGISKLRNGVSAKESVRKRDLVTERDIEYTRAEVESRNRWSVQEYASKLRRLLIDNGLEHVIPQWPVLEAVPPRAPGSSPPITDDTDK